MSKKYINPPLIEALCEFQFDSESLWDLTLPGLIYEKLKETFPRRQQLQVTLGVANIPEASGQIGIMPMIPLVRFLDDEGKVLVQLGQNLLTVNHLKPYPSWEEFLPLIRKSFTAYLETAHPKKLQHLGIRYINRIEIPSSHINLENYFQFHPVVSKELPQDIDAFFLAVNISYEESKDTLRIQLTTTDSEVPNTLAIILEISYVFAKPGEVALDSVLEGVDTAHKHVERAFESCITDELRQIFGEVKE